MQLLSALALLAAAATPGRLSSVDMSCDCRLWHLRHFSFNLHCTGEQNGSSMVNCQRSEVLEIPHGYQYIAGYALVKLYPMMKTWPAAKKACEDEGAQLAVPRDRRAYDGIKQIVYTSYLAGNVGWGSLGITDQLVEGVWMGVDGRPVTHLPWRRGQPSNSGGNENCVDVNSGGGINDVSCSVTAPYICERRIPVAVPDGYKWVEDARRFYRLHSERHVYVEAIRVCRSENARLAVPDTWRRGEALLKQFPNVEPNSFQQHHIGFTDEATEGDFVTDTGRHLRDMEFQAWKDGQPNNDNGRPENCLALSERGYYNDVRCDLELPFICEILPV